MCDQERQEIDEKERWENKISIKMNRDGILSLEKWETV